MRRIRSLVFLLIFISLSSPIFAAIYKVTEPPDKLKTLEDILYLKGQGAGLAALTVNGTRIDISKDGSFKCGLVLKRGKNLVQVIGWNKAGQAQITNLRILHFLSFPDIEEIVEPRRHWARNEIITLATLGIVEGYPDGNFYYDRLLSRGELATYLCRAKGYKKTYPVEDPFPDVPKEHWRAPYIKTIADRGLMRARSDGLFGIDDGLKRGEIAAIIARAEGEKVLKDIQAIFYDVPKQSPYAQSILLAKRKGLVRGISYSAPIFDPNRDMTRAEAAILFSRFGFVKEAQKWLFDFSTGYDKRSFCQINTPPKILQVTVTPPQLSVFNENAIVTIRALVEDREGLKNLLNVKADLTNLGGPWDAVMYDDGRGGDLKAEDGEFTLSVTPTVETWGEKMINITATDKGDWSVERAGYLTIVR